MNSLRNAININGKGEHKSFQCLIMSSFLQCTGSNMFHYILLLLFQPAFFVNHPVHFMQILHHLILPSSSLFHPLPSHSFERKKTSIKQETSLLSMYHFAIFWDQKHYSQPNSFIISHVWFVWLSRFVFHFLHIYLIQNAAICDKYCLPLLQWLSFKRYPVVINRFV